MTGGFHKTFIFVMFRFVITDKFLSTIFLCAWLPHCSGLLRNFQLQVDSNMAGKINNQKLAVITNL